MTREKRLTVLKEEDLINMVMDIMQKDDVDEAFGIMYDRLGLTADMNGGKYTDDVKFAIVKQYEMYHHDKNIHRIYCSNSRDEYDYEDWLFDNIDNSVVEDLLYDEYLDSTNEDDETNYDDFVYTIEQILKDHPIVMSGKQARWDGTYDSGYIFTDVNKFKQLISPGYPCTITFILDDKLNEFYMTESSHDCPTGGTVLYFRLMTDEGVKKWMDSDDDYQNDRSTVEEYFNSDILTRPFSLYDI